MRQSLLRCPLRAASHSLLGMLAVQALGQRPVLARPARAHASARQAPAWHRGSRRARAAGAPRRADSRTVGSRAQPRPVKHLRTLRPAPGAPARCGSAQRPAPRLGRARTPGVPITHRGAARPPEQGRCAGNHVHSAAAHRAGADAPSRTGAKPSCPRAANAARACWAIFCGRARARPAAPLRTRAGVCTWRRPEKVWWPRATWRTL